MKAKSASSKRPTKRTAKTLSIAAAINIDPHLEAARTKIGPSARMKGPAERRQNYAIQQFENGWMLEPFADTPDTRNVFVLFQSKQMSKVCRENWKQGDRSDSCPNIPPPTGNLVKPQRGFGQVWCGKSPNGGLIEQERTSIGSGKWAEFGQTPLTYHQEFDKGILFGGQGFQVNYQVSGVSSTIVFILYTRGPKKDTWDIAQ